MNKRILKKIKKKFLIETTIKAFRDFQKACDKFTNKLLTKKKK